LSPKDLECEGNGSEGADQKERPAGGPALLRGEAIRQQESEAGAEGGTSAGDQGEFWKSDLCFSHENTSR
jgi:hypothetical protein